VVVVDVVVTAVATKELVEVAAVVVVVKKLHIMVFKFITF